MKAVLDGRKDVELLNMSSIQLLERAVMEAPDFIAMKQPATELETELSWTYSQLLSDARKLASFLSEHFDYGDNIAIWGSNSGQWFLYQLAAAHLGVTLVTLNPSIQKSEFEYMMSKSQAKGLIMERQFRGSDLCDIVDSSKSNLQDLKSVFYLDEWRDHIKRGSGDPPPSPTRPEDPALIVFTSGTTGKPKAALLNHYGIVNNANMSAMRAELPRGSTWLQTLPAFHVGGTVANCLATISQASRMVIMPPFEPGKVLQLMESEKINFAMMVPAMVIPMVEHANFPQTDLSSLRLLKMGGTTITPSLIELVRHKIGCQVQVTLGQTEMGGETAMTRPGDSDEVLLNTVGTPHPHTTLKIVGIESRELLEVGEVGEICVKSPFAIKEYFADQKATEGLYDDDGYVMTGDLGVVDDNGHLKMSGRLKEVIIRGGQNIYPREIEDAIAEFPGVAESAVLGLPHVKWGEEVAAVLRWSDDHPGELGDLKAFLHQRLASYKQPRHWRVVNEFPRNAFGKTQKFLLADFFNESDTPTEGHN